jgi:hypothetical protein
MNFYYSGKLDWVWEFIYLFSWFLGFSHWFRVFGLEIGLMKWLKCLFSVSYENIDENEFLEI